jgi:hypothetical protein
MPPQNLNLNMANAPQPPWLAQGVVAVLGAIHDLPNSPKNLLPKFDLEKDNFPKDHINKFMLSLHLMNVQHEDVVCHLFPYTFQGKSSTCFFSLPQCPITNWEQFEKAFMTEFGEDKSPTALVLEISIIKMDLKEKAKDFNERFLTLLNKMPTTLRPTYEVLSEFYIDVLLATPSMFIKSVGKETLKGTFNEAINVEKVMLSMRGNPSSEENKSQPSTKNPIIKSS